MDNNPLEEPLNPPSVQPVGNVSYNPAIKNVLILLGLILVGVATYFFIRSQIPQDPTVNNPSSSSITTSVSPSPQKKDIPLEVLQTKLYFQTSDTASGITTVYEQIPLNGEPKVFLEADEYAFSPDQTKVAYIKGYGENSDLNFYILDLNTNQTRPYLTDSDTKRGLEWSPEGTHILVNSGTGASGTNDIYEVASGKHLGNFGGISGHVWSTNNVLYNDELNTNVSNRPWESGYATGIVQFNIVTQQKLPILEGDKLNDYFASKVKGNCLVFTRRYVETEQEWGDDSKYKTETNCYDIVSGGQFVIPDGSELSKETNEDFLKILMKTFQKKEYDILIIENKDIKDWKVVSVHTGNSVYSNDIYIINEKDPENTLKKIGSGGGISWIK